MTGPPRQLVLVLSTLAIACAAGPAPRPPALAAAPPPPPARASEAAPAPARAGEASAPGLLFSVEPEAADLLVDGRSLGKVQDLPGGFVPLSPGLYQVSLKHPGFVTWRAEVAVRGGVEALRITLTKKP